MVGGLKAPAETRRVKLKNLRGRTLLAEQRRYPLFVFPGYCLADHDHVKNMLPTRAYQRKFGHGSNNRVTGLFQN